MIPAFSERRSLAPEKYPGGDESIACRFTPRTPRRHVHPDSKPTVPAAEVGQLLTLGLALGHQRFELVSLAGRDRNLGAAMATTTEWSGGARTGESDSKEEDAAEDPRRKDAPQASRGASPRNVTLEPRLRICARLQPGEDGLREEVEWLRDRVDNLSRELLVARRDSGRLAEQLKQEEEVGREQRRRADNALRKGRALKEELHRLKESRTTCSAASRAVLSDAHDRSVRMAERRRRQQAESLMQAYKGLYEDQLQTQHASAESYRSLTRGYSRLSADNKALRHEAAIAVVGTSSPAAGTSDNARMTIPSHAGASASATENDERLQDGFTKAGSEKDGGHMQGSSAAESAAAVATAAAAVVHAAGAFAKASVSTVDVQGYPYGNAERVKCSLRRSEDSVGRRGNIFAPTLDRNPASPSCGEISMAGEGPKKRVNIDGTAFSGLQEHPDDPSTADTVNIDDECSSDDADGNSDDRYSTSEGYAFPPAARHVELPRSSSAGGEPEEAWLLKRSQATTAVAIPPSEPAPRWRGRPTGPGRGLVSAASWIQSVDVPKRSSSPSPPGRGRWGGCSGGGGRGWTGKDGCTRIEPSRTRPHSI